FEGVDEETAVAHVEAIWGEPRTTTQAPWGDTVPSRDLDDRVRAALEREKAGAARRRRLNPAAPEAERETDVVPPTTFVAPVDPTREQLDVPVASPRSPRQRRVLIVGALVVLALLATLLTFTWSSSDATSEDQQVCSDCSDVSSVDEAERNDTRRVG